jgi:hypothetical protein
LPPSATEGGVPASNRGSVNDRRIDVAYGD